MVVIQGKEINPESFDRNDIVPYQEGLNLLPHCLIFHELHHLAKFSKELVVKDMNSGHHANYQQFLSDIIACRNRIFTALDPDMIENIRDQREVCILIWSEGYEFIVAFFAVLALGAVCVPCSPHITVQEATHNAKVVRACATITSSKFKEMALEIRQHLSGNTGFHVIESTDLLLGPIIPIEQIHFSSNRVFDQNKTALVIFSSGTTGPPKGVATRRFNIYFFAWFFIKNHGIRPNTTVMQFLPTHHATGLLVNTIPSILGGACVEFSQGGLQASKLWDRLKSGGVPVFSAVPTVYVRLLNHWDTVISKLSHCDRETYRAGAAKVRAYHSSTSSLPRRVADRWLELTGLPIFERYGSSEAGNVYQPLPGYKYVAGSVGVKNPSVESFLTEGNHGEIRCRHPALFNKYMFDPEATAAAFDERGFYKTGDIARKEEDYYFIEGRSSIDILKSGGYKISALDVEHEILENPRIAEAIVVGVEDEEYGQRVAAAVVLKDKSDSLTLSELRTDLRERLSTYKMPTILRVVPELQKTNTMKVPKIFLKNKLFDLGHPDVQVWKSRAIAKL